MDILNTSLTYHKVHTVGKQRREISYNRKQYQLHQMLQTKLVRNFKAKIPEGETGSYRSLWLQYL